SLAAARLARWVPGGAAMAARVQRFLFGPNAPEMPLPDGGDETGRLPEVLPAQGERRGRVALLAGCVMPVLFGRVNAARARLLAANGLEVVTPPGQGCCGAFHLHNGHLDDARQRARQLIETFEAVECDVILVNSAGCGSAMKEYGHLFHGDPGWEQRAAA